MYMCYVNRQDDKLLSFTCIYFVMILGRFIHSDNFMFINIIFMFSYNEQPVRGTLYLQLVSFHLQMFMATVCSVYRLHTLTFD